MTSKINKIQQKIQELQAQLTAEQKADERRRARAVELAAKTTGLLALGLSKQTLEREFKQVVLRINAANSSAHTTGAVE